MSSLHLTLLDATAPDWPKVVAQMDRLLRPDQGPYLLPRHFVQVVLPAIGGHLARLERQEHTVGYAVLLPRALDRGVPVFTLRCHPLEPNPPWSPEELQEAAGRALPGAQVVPYDPRAPHTFSPTSHRQNGLDLGRPSPEEAQAIPELQQRIWGNPPDQLYPVDIHSQEFRLATSLVARVEGRPVGFLLGFFRFDSHPLPPCWAARFQARLRIESQTLGVLPAYRGRHIGFHLKRLQALQAQAQGIHLVHWTVDPLLWPNAVLNFVRLRAIATEFHPNYYPLHNALNRVAPSRFRLTWLVATERVRRAWAQTDSQAPVDLSRAADVVWVNRGERQAHLSVDAPRIAVEIPRDWTRMQREEPARARRWRSVTDALFQHYLGTEPGRYVVTQVGVAGKRRALIARRVDEGLLDELAR